MMANKTSFGLLDFNNALKEGITYDTMVNITQNCKRVVLEHFWIAWKALQKKMEKLSEPSCPEINSVQEFIQKCRQPGAGDEQRTLYSELTTRVLIYFVGKVDGVYCPECETFNSNDTCTNCKADNSHLFKLIIRLHSECRG